MKNGQNVLRVFGALCLMMLTLFGLVVDAGGDSGVGSAGAGALDIAAAR